MAFQALFLVPVGVPPNTNRNWGEKAVFRMLSCELMAESATFPPPSLFRRTWNHVVTMMAVCLSFLPLAVEASSARCRASCRSTRLIVELVGTSVEHLRKHGTE